jgi:hypothetical protein
MRRRRARRNSGSRSVRHGFALGVPGTTTTLMLDELTAWLASRKIIPAAKH